MMRRVLLGLVLLGVPAWAQASWEAWVPGLRISPTSGAFSLLPPPEWNANEGVDAVLVSRNGPLLDSLLVEWLAHGAASKRLPHGSSPESLPEDLAEDYVAGLQAAGYAEIKLLELEPAELLGQPAFRVHLNYRLQEQAGGALMELVALGTTTPTGVLIVTFDAPVLHYFPEYWPLARESLQSLQWGPTAQPAAESPPAN